MSLRQYQVKDPRPAELNSTLITALLTRVTSPLAWTTVSPVASEVTETRCRQRYPAGC